MPEKGADRLHDGSQSQQDHTHLLERLAWPGLHRKVAPITRATRVKRTIGSPPSGRRAPMTDRSTGTLERPALRALVPQPLRGLTVMDAGCGAGAQCEWLLNHGADVVGFDLSPAMIEQARQRCGDRARFFVGDLEQPLSVEAHSIDGITCSLALHYLEDWGAPLRSFADALRPDGWLVLSLDHPFGPPLPSQSGGYFDTELVTDTWNKQGVEVRQRFWRRPPSVGVVGAFSDAGFVIDRIGEPQPSPEALRRFPEELAQVNGTPWFIVYRLILRAA